MKGFGLLARSALVLSFLFVAMRTEAQQITVNVRTDGQPASGLTVIFLAANTIKPTSTAITSPAGTSVLDLSNIIKAHGQVQAQIVVRICKDGKNVVYIVQQGQQVPPQDQKCVDNKDCECKDRGAGLFVIGDGDTVNLDIHSDGTVEVHVIHASSVAPGTPPAQTQPTSHNAVSTSGFTPSIQLRGFGGASFINGNTPPTTGFDGAVLFPLGNRVIVGPTAGFQWVNSSVIQTIGGGPPPSTFIHTSVGFKNGNFGGQLQFPLSGFQLGIRGGATVAGSTITQASGFCGTGGPTLPAGCHVLGSTTTHDTVVGPFVGGYISHNIFSHVGVFVEYDYARLQDTRSAGTGSSSGRHSVFDLHYNTAIAGLTVSFGRHVRK